MAAPKKLWKTTLVIWSDFDPQNTEIEDLARDATSGESYCSTNKHEFVEDLEKDPDWDGTEFFGVDKDDDE